MTLMRPSNLFGSLKSSPLYEEEKAVDGLPPSEDTSGVNLPVWPVLIDDLISAVDTRAWFLE